METKNEKIEFTSAIRYAFALRFGVPDSPKGVGNIGFVFGGSQHATICQEYIDRAYNDDQLRINITPSLVTAKVELIEVADSKTVCIAELNYDRSELMNFQEKAPAAGRVALIFGFKRGCDYYITGNAKDKTEDFSPILLANFEINH